MVPPPLALFSIALFGASTSSPSSGLFALNLGLIRACEARSVSLPIDYPVPSSSSSTSTAYRGTISDLDYTPSSSTNPTPRRNIHNFPGDDIVLFPHADLKAGCAFKFKSRTYDICPLLSRAEVIRIDYDDDGPAKASPSYESTKFEGKGKAKAEWERRAYMVTLGGATRSESESCPKGTRICLTEHEHDGLQTTTTIVAGPPQDKTPVYIQNFARNGREFDLWLINGKVGAKVTLACNQVEKLEYHDELAGIHVLRWDTQHACPVGGFRTSEEENDPEPSDEDGDKESHEEDLVTGGLPVGGVSRKWLGIIALLVGCIVISTAILISSPQARQYAFAHLQSAGNSVLPLFTDLKQLSKPVRKHLPHFRTGEGMLVRWAQEEMTLDGEEDLMVNGSGVGQGWSDCDEYIPLKASSRTNSSLHALSAGTDVRWSFKTYGSVPFAAFDIDEHEVDLGPVQEFGAKSWIHGASARVRGLFRR